MALNWLFLLRLLRVLPLDELPHIADNLILSLCSWNPYLFLLILRVHTFSLWPNDRIELVLASSSWLVSFLGLSHSFWNWGSSRFIRLSWNHRASVLPTVFTLMWVDPLHLAHSCLMPWSRSLRLRLLCDLWISSATQRLVDWGWRLSWHSPRSQSSSVLTEKQRSSLRQPRSLNT